MNKHLTDKEMVMMCASTNASLTKYASVISETANSSSVQPFSRFATAMSNSSISSTRWPNAKVFTNQPLRLTRRTSRRLNRKFPNRAFSKGTFYNVPFFIADFSGVCDIFYIKQQRGNYLCV